MKRWKINLINFLFYEILISNITIIIWRGFDYSLDKYFDTNYWICLLIGYILYFLLIYTQKYLTIDKFKHEFWMFFIVNFPQFHRTLHQFLIFITCVFLWHGIWILYDLHIDIFQSFYQTYLFLYILSFLFLTFIRTASSTNGPLSNTDDESIFLRIIMYKKSLEGDGTS